MHKRSRLSLGSWWKPTATPAVWCPTLDNAVPASGLVGERGRILENPAKYRLYRPHRPQSAYFQGFRAGGTITGYRPPVDRYRPQLVDIDCASTVKDLLRLQVFHPLR